ncbi:RHS repeat-associated core domain-containing protein [Akkermansia glycaniphila]|nr:RHS repeat-associated core domain-containing protein [Akkermansia glycaniphila]
MAKENPFRFSSEHHDEGLGLVYYNYRRYNPMGGRWISREPIAEQGGWNLCEFVRNRPLYYTDILGVYGKDIYFYFNYYVALYLCLDRHLWICM